MTEHLNDQTADVYTIHIHMYVCMYFCELAEIPKYQVKAETSRY